MKHMMKPLLVAALTAATLAWTLPARADDGEGGNAANGKRLFATDGCYECHGYVGQGGRNTGPNLVPDLLPFDAFVTQLRTPADEMPPFTEKVLSDKEAHDIYAYLKSLPKPPALKDIPILSH